MHEVLLPSSVPTSGAITSLYSRNCNAFVFLSAREGAFQTKGTNNETRAHEVDCIVSTYSDNVLRPNGTTTPLSCLDFSLWCLLPRQVLRLLPFLVLRVMYEILQTLILKVVTLDMSHAQVISRAPPEM